MADTQKVDCAYLSNEGKCWAVNFAARDGVAVEIDAAGKCVAKPEFESQCKGRISGREALARAREGYSKRERE